MVIVMVTEHSPPPEIFPRKPSEVDPFQQVETEAEEFKGLTQHSRLLWRGLRSRLRDSDSESEAGPPPATPLPVLLQAIALRTQW